MPKITKVDAIKRPFRSIKAQYNRPLSFRTLLTLAFKMKIASNADLLALNPNYASLSTLLFVIHFFNFLLITPVKFLEKQLTSVIPL